MVSVERIGETEASIIFCLNNTHIFEYPKQANQEERDMLADIYEGWAEYLRMTPPF
jgi:hypothetical protein